MTDPSEPRRPEDPGYAGARPLRSGVYERPRPGRGTTAPLMVTLAVIVLVLAVLYAFFASSFSATNRLGVLPETAAIGPPAG